MTLQEFTSLTICCKESVWKVFRKFSMKIFFYWDWLIFLKIVCSPVLSLLTVPKVRRRVERWAFLQYKIPVTTVVWRKIYTRLNEFTKPLDILWCKLKLYLMKVIISRVCHSKKIKQLYNSVKCRCFVFQSAIIRLCIIN